MSLLCGGAERAKRIRESDIFCPTSALQPVVNASQTIAGGQHHSHSTREKIQTRRRRREEGEGGGEEVNSLTGGGTSPPPPLCCSLTQRFQTLQAHFVVTSMPVQVYP